jgi:D-glycero-D-manno-heptose 1,7-bisphosphate phosphatase
MNEDRYVLLDRDGVINHDSEHFIKSPEEWLPIEGSLEAIAMLNQHGYKVVVITNQSGIARGLFDTKTLNDIHAKMQQMVVDHGGVIDAIYSCPHGPDNDCNCRKPKSGLLELFAQEKNVDLTTTTFIGDSFRDIQAAQAVGATPILVKTGKGEKTLINHPNLTIEIFDNLYDATNTLIARS